MTEFRHLTHNIEQLQPGARATLTMELEHRMSIGFVHVSAADPVAVVLVGTGEDS